MKDNDSYPPSATTNTGTVETETMTEDEDTKPVENFSDSDDSDLSEKWDGEEAEYVADDEAEDYEEESTGIKIKYKLKPNEIYSFVKHSESFQNNLKLQKKHTFIQAVVLGAMVALTFAVKNTYYLWFAAFPVVVILLLWLIPFISVKKMISQVSNSKEIVLEIFPDKIDIIENGVQRELLLDGSYESKEEDDVIVIYKNKVIDLMLPLRAVEPEFRAEVQAIILSGVKSGEDE